MPMVLKCKMCGGDIEVVPGTTVKDLPVLRLHHDPAADRQRQSPADV